MFKVEMFIFFILMVLFFGIAAAILKGKLYGLISGFNQKSEEEQERLIRHGFPQALGRLFLLLGIVFLIGLIFVSFKIPYAFEVTMLIMVILLFARLIRLQKFGKQAKRKRNYFITILFSIIFVGVITVMLVISTRDVELNIQEETFEITGMYGDTWPTDAISQVEIIEKLPEINRKTNGFDFLAYRKGHFDLDKYGKGMLFIKNKEGPFLMIHLKETYLILNADESQVNKWYNKLLEVLY